MLGGITIIFIALLTLSTDVLEKFKMSNDPFDEVISHLGELLNVNCDQYRSVLSSVREMRHRSDSTYFIFVSPQFLVKQKYA